MVAIAAVVIAIMMGILGTKGPVIKSQKARCSTNGIELPNYNDFPQNATDAANALLVNYGGNQMTCDTTSEHLDSLKASCEIGNPDKPLITLEVNATNCRFLE